MGLCDSIARQAKGSHGSRERSCRILAKSIYRELKLNGFGPKDIVAIATELLGLVTEELRPAGADQGSTTEQPTDTEASIILPLDEESATEARTSARSAV